MAAMTLATNVQVGDKLVLQEVGPRCFAFVREGSKEFVPIRVGLGLRVELPPSAREALGLPKEPLGHVCPFEKDAAVCLSLGRHKVALHELGSGVVLEVFRLGEAYGGNSRDVQREVSVRPRES